MNKIRVGITGCGQITRIGHIPNLLDIETVEITAINDVNLENLEAAGNMVPNAEKFSDFDEMLHNSRTDAIIIASPNWLHCEQTVKALECGKHVFCEKPLGISLKEATKIRQAHQKARTILQVGHELRHAKAYETAKEKVKAGVIGNIKMIRYSEFRKPLLSGWRQTGKTGGVMLEKNSHFFDLFNWFAETIPSKVFASGANDVNRDSPLIDNCFVTVEYKNGIRASLTMCLFCEHGGENIFELVGDKGIIKIKNENLQIFRRDGNGEKVELNCSLEKTEGMHPGCRRQFREFIHCIHSGKLPLNNINNAIQTLHLSLAAEESVTARRIVHIN